MQWLSNRNGNGSCNIPSSLNGRAWKARYRSIAKRLATCVWRKTRNLGLSQQCKSLSSSWYWPAHQVGLEEGRRCLLWQSSRFCPNQSDVRCHCFFLLVVDPMRMTKTFLKTKTNKVKFGHKIIPDIWMTSPLANWWKSENKMSIANKGSHIMWVTNLI